jgi:predicted AlkP superfamily phosphohydrolase/phosphomutase
MCWEDGALRSRIMVMSSPHNFDKLPNLSYIFSCFCDPYNDKIAEWLEDSYKKNVQGNGKVILDLFLNDDYKGKYDVFLSYFDTLPFLLLIFNFVFISRLELL